MNPWTVASQAKFTSSFGRTNYGFKCFELVLESGGDPIDVEFNYKDLAHLKVVHNTFDIFYSHITDDVQTCVVMQKLFGMRFPLILMWTGELTAKNMSDAFFSFINWNRR